MRRIIILWALLMLLAQGAMAGRAEQTFTYLNGIYEQFDKVNNDYLITELESWLEVGPDAARAGKVHLILGRTYEERGKKHLALALFARNVFLHPQSPEHGECLEGALRHVNQLSPYKKQPAPLVKLLKAPPMGTGKASDRHFAWLQFLSKLDASKLHERTIQETSLFISRYTDDPRLEMVDLWLALSWANKGKQREAVLGLEKLKFLYPQGKQIAYAEFNRADIMHRNLNRSGDAVIVLDGLLAEHRDSRFAADGMALRAEIKTKKLLDHQGAVADYRQLIAEWPSHGQVPAARLQVADILMKKIKDFDQAAAEYRQISAPVTDPEEGVRLLAKAAKIYQDKLKNYDKAIACYQELLDRYPAHKKAAEFRKRITKLQEKASQG
jgi:tetratricopeptide (TPR) repeat protein